MKVESNVGFTDEPAVTYGPTYRPLAPADLEGLPDQ